MISTVTVSTITTISSTTTTTAIAGMEMSALLGIVAVVALVGFLTAKELASATNSTSLQYAGRFFNIGILPLVMSFAVIVVTKVIEFL